MTPEMIDAMLENGLTKEQIAALVKADLVARQSAEEAKRAAKRAGAAERQQRYRERHRTEKSADSNAMSRVTDVTARDECDTPPAPLSPKDIQNPLPPLPPAEAIASVRPKRLRTTYSDDFEKFWVGYPTDAIMSKKEAFAEWQKLNPDERIEAIESLTGFNGYCQTHSDYRPVHANRYLKQRRFETVGKAQRAVNQQVFISTDDPLWAEWHAYGLRTRRKPYPTTQRVIEGRSVTGWTFPSARPPPIEHQRRMEAAE